MTALTLAAEFLGITEKMAEQKESNRNRRVELAEQYAADLAALREQERALSAQRAQVALKMTLTGRNLDALGRLVGVSGPFICQLARKARKENRDG